jgi:ribosomal protein S18 acetylase RimI-like enzyme
VTHNLKRLAPADWPLLRDARLEALRDSPYAFTSTYADESKWTESEWRRFLETATWVVASEAEKVIGLARSVCDLETLTRHIESVWVAPGHRRRGVCRTLLHALAEMDRQTDLLLWVLEDNHAHGGPTRRSALSGPRRASPYQD